MEPSLESLESSSDVSGRKRRRYSVTIKDKIRDGIICPPSQTSQVKIKEGYLTWSCPSKDGKSVHEIKLIVEEGNIIMQCDCLNRHGEHESKNCRHINMVVLKFLTTYFDNASKFMEDKEKHEELQKDVSDLIGKMNGMSM
jgi:hypothetical protein